MKYKVGDEVLAKVKIKSIENNRLTSLPYEVKERNNKQSCAATIWIREEDIQQGPQITAEEAWELARRIVLNEDEGGIKSSDLLDAFGTNYWHEIMKNNNSPQEVKARIEALEAAKVIKIGDEVALKSSPNNDDCKFFVTYIDGESGEISGLSGFDGGVFFGRDIKQYQKTGRHIDIEGLLRNIRGIDA